MIATVRSYKGEHTVMESKPSDVVIDDLRISQPFPALKNFAMEIPLATLDKKEYSHVPYVVILIRMLEEWK